MFKPYGRPTIGVARARDFRRFVKGEPLDVERLNGLMDRVNELGRAVSALDLGWNPIGRGGSGGAPVWLYCPTLPPYTPAKDTLTCQQMSANGDPIGDIFEVKVRWVSSDKAVHTSDTDDVPWTTVAPLPIAGYRRLLAYQVASAYGNGWWAADLLWDTCAP